jgi:hypothetical protein
MDTQQQIARDVRVIRNQLLVKPTLTTLCLAFAVIPPLALFIVLFFVRLLAGVGHFVTRLITP